MLTLLLACSTEVPLPLPAPQPPVWRAKGRQVAAADLRGYLVMPQTTPAAGVLVLVDAVSEAERQAAHALAEGGAVVLLLPPSTDTDRGADYLSSLPTTRGITTRCQRTVCP